MPEALVERWALRGSGVGSLGRYDGTPADMAGWPASFFKNQLTCGEFNGANSVVTVGDVVELNAVSAFSMLFWMAQDVIDQSDRIFEKCKGINNATDVFTHTSGEFRFRIADGSDTYGYFDYSTLISAVTWVHIAVVFDGTQNTNATRLIVYLNGSPVTLSYNGTIPAATDDSVGCSASIGRSSQSLNGRLHDFRLYSIPLSRDMVNQIIHEPAALV